MDDLIERLEKATDQDQELDARICYVTKPALQRLGTVEQWLQQDAAKRVRAYTWSIDDALTLIPDGWIWNLRTEKHASFPDSSAHAEIMDRHWPDPLAGYGICEEGHAATPAIALCIAALKARNVITKTPLKTQESA